MYLSFKQHIVTRIDIFKSKMKIKLLEKIIPFLICFSFIKTTNKKLKVLCVKSIQYLLLLAVNCIIHTFVSLEIKLKQLSRLPYFVRLNESDNYRNQSH